MCPKVLELELPQRQNRGKKKEHPHQVLSTDALGKADLRGLSKGVTQAEPKGQSVSRDMLAFYVEETT